MYVYVLLPYRNILQSCSEKQMNTNNHQNINDEKNYAVIISSIAFKKSLTMHVSPILLGHATSNWHLFVDS